MRMTEEESREQAEYSIWWHYYSTIDKKDAEIAAWEASRPDGDPVKMKCKEDRLAELRAEREALVRSEPIDAAPPGAMQAAPVRGITKQQVMNAFDGLHFGCDQWGKYLATPPNWLKECRVAPGNKSTSALWNPVKIASGLYDKNVPIKRLDAVFVALRDWAEEWAEVSDGFREPYRARIPDTCRTPTGKPV